MMEFVYRYQQIVKGINMKLKNILIPAVVIILTHVQISYGQENPSLRTRANQYYLEYSYAKAIPAFLKLVDVKNPRLTDLERLAESYLKVNQYEAARNWYARVVVHPDATPSHLLHYAEVLKNNAQYAEAKRVLEEYAGKTGDANRVAMDIEGCDSALVWLQKPTAHKIINQTHVNTERSEFGVSRHNNTYYYAGEPQSNTDIYGWTGHSFLRIFTANEGNAGLERPTIVSESINDELYHAGPVISSRDGKTRFATRTYPGKQEAEISVDAKKKYRTKNLELVIYKQNAAGEWEGNAFAYNNTSAYSVGHAALSTDERTLYFTSDMPGGQGGTDIWYAELQPDGSWGQPKNAGNVINTPGEEQFPVIAEDGTLFYSSNGLAGMGGLDIFRAEGSRNQWTKPQNLRYPVNSAGDDFAFTVTQTEQGSKGYFSSNRPGGKGGDDIYAFRYEQPAIVLALSGITYDKNTGKVLPGAEVILYSGHRELKARSVSDHEGRFFFQLDKDAAYSLTGQKAKYHADSAGVSTVGITRSDTLSANLYLEPVFEVGKTFTLENIYYDFDKHHIRPDAAAVLDELVRTLRDNPTLKIELSSHTDSRGSDAYNMALSQRRAQSAVDYLVKQGIARDRMTAKGYGESKLVNRCSNGVDCSAQEHQANRRTEVTVLAF